MFIKLKDGRKLNLFYLSDCFIGKHDKTVVIFYLVNGVKIVDEAVEYVKENKESFLSHWYGRIGDEQLRKVLTGIMSLKEAEEDAMQNGVE